MAEMNDGKPSATSLGETAASLPTSSSSRPLPADFSSALPPTEHQDSTLPRAIPHRQKQIVSGIPSNEGDETDGGDRRAPARPASAPQASMAFARSGCKRPHANSCGGFGAVVEADSCDRGGKHRRHDAPRTTPTMAPAQYVDTTSDLFQGTSGMGAQVVRCAVECAPVHAGARDIRTSAAHQKTELVRRRKRRARSSRNDNHEAAAFTCIICEQRFLTRSNRQAHYHMCHSIGHSV